MLLEIEGKNKYLDEEWENAEKSGEPKKYYKVIKSQDYNHGKTNLYTFRLYTPSLARVVAGRTGDILKDLDGNEIIVKYINGEYVEVSK